MTVRLKMTKNTDYLNRIFAFAREEILKSGTALTYLAQRGVTERQLYDLGLGYVPSDKWPPYIDPDKACPEEAHYLDKSRRGFKIKGKILFPLTNAMGDVRGLQARTPDLEVKDYWKFYDLHADIDALFFGLEAAMPHIWERREIVLVEGIFDLFPVQRVFPNAVCLGTARVTNLQLKFMRRYVRDVLLLLDNDEYGEAASRKFQRDHGRDFQSVQRIPYLGKDPSSSWERLGEEKFAAQFKVREVLSQPLSLHSTHRLRR